MAGRCYSATVEILRSFGARGSGEKKNGPGCAIDAGGGNPTFSRGLSVEKPSPRRASIAHLHLAWELATKPLCWPSPVFWTTKTSSGEAPAPAGSPPFANSERLRCLARWSGKRLVVGHGNRRQGNIFLFFVSGRIATSTHWRRGRPGNAPRGARHPLMPPSGVLPLLLARTIVFCSRVTIPTSGARTRRPRNFGMAGLFVPPLGRKENSVVSVRDTVP